MRRVTPKARKLLISPAANLSGTTKRGPIFGGRADRAAGTDRPQLRSSLADRIKITDMISMMPLRTIQSDGVRSRLGGGTSVVAGRVGAACSVASWRRRQSVFRPESAGEHRGSWISGMDWYTRNGRSTVGGLPSRLGIIRADKSDTWTRDNYPYIVDRAKDNDHYWADSTSIPSN